MSSLAQAFRERFGRAPVGVWSAPGRANLIGDHTDYNGGLALPFAIDRRIRVALAPRDDRQVRVASLEVDGTGEASLDDLGRDDPLAVQGWSPYPLGLVWALGRHLGTLGDARGFDALFESDIPVGAGVSSSHALACALAVGLVDLWHLELGTDELIRIGQLTENVAVGAPTGTLDQSAILRAETGTGVLLDFGRDRFDLVPLDFAAAGMAVLLINSHVEHAHAEAGYGERRAECELVARELGVTFVSDLTLQHLDEAAGRVPAAALRRARHVVTENERVRQVALLLADGRIAEVGPVLTASHASMRDDFENSVPAIDLAVEAALGAGALGARLTGGGFGGSCLALVRIGDADAVAESVVARVTAAGHARPSVTAIAPSAGAGREAGA